jgi:hypothetical protein
MLRLLFTRYADKKPDLFKQLVCCNIQKSQKENVLELFLEKQFDSDVEKKKWKFEFKAYLELDTQNVTASTSSSFFASSQHEPIASSQKTTSTPSAANIESEERRKTYKG